MGIDINVLITNTNKLKEYIDKNERREQEKKDKQSYTAIERKVKKEEYNREKPRSQDRTIKKGKRLIKKGASPEVLTRLRESLREQEKYYIYYIRNFLLELNRKISKELDPIKKEKIRQAISEITYNSKHCFNSTATHKQNNHRNSENSELENGYGSDIENDHKVETNNIIVSNSTQLLKAIKNQNDKKFKKHLKNCMDISSIKDKEEKNTLYFIAFLKRKQKLKFLGTLIKTVSRKNSAQSICSKDDGKTPIQEILINKITEEKHESNMIQNNNNTLKFFTKLLRHKTNYSNLELFTEELQGLKEEQKVYYHNFLEKSTELIKQPKSEQKPDIEKKIKDIIIRTINILDINSNYLLHSAINNYDKKLFKELLQKGLDVSFKDINGNNALHLIISKLKKEQKLEFLNILLKVGQKEQFIDAINNRKNQEGQTPFHKLLQYIQKKSEKSSLTSFENTKRYKALKLLLENGADITVKDSNKRNALHYIASLKGEQKVVCLDLVVKSTNIPENKLSQAINASNGKKQTPIQVALISKAVKSRHNLPNPRNRDNTIKFCVKLLQNGADQKQLILPKLLWNRENYQTIKGIEKSMGKLLIPDNMRTNLKLNFGKKFKVRDIVKRVNNVAYKVIITLIFAALTCAVVFSAAQGSITITTTSSTIAAIGICYLICFNLENIYEKFKKAKRKFTGEKQIIPQGKIPKNDTQYNNSSKRIKNIPNGLEEQKTQELQDQSKYIESPPSFKIEGISISQFTKELLESNNQFNKSSLLAL